MARREALPHLFIATPATARRFTSPLAGGGRARIKRRDRQLHGEGLLLELFDALVESDDGDVLRLEFESEPDFDLLLTSLDADARRGIELLNSRRSDKITYATVLVAPAKLGYFHQLFEDYLLKSRGRAGEPSNRSLVESISHVRRASVRSMWTDPTVPFPETSDAIWWEAWLRRTADAEAEFRDRASDGDLQVSQHALLFIDRIVVNVRATVLELSRLLDRDDLLAELRSPAATADEFLNLDGRQQREWAENLAQRIDVAPPDAPVVCILDTGVTRAHPLLQDSLQASAWHTVKQQWGPGDSHGHGTKTAGTALFGDLGPLLLSNQPVPLLHALESVKLIPAPGQIHEEGSLGAVTQEAIARAEIADPARRRVVCLTVTAEVGDSSGHPTSWSAAVDEAAHGGDTEQRRLICVAAGNAPSTGFGKYPVSNRKEQVRAPGQAWNVLPVGAYADRDAVNEPDFSGWSAVASRGDLCPSSCTSLAWDHQWPLKPEIVLPGGNAACDGTGATDFPESLCLLTTFHQPLAKPFTGTGETSSATALAARMAARIQAHYPDLWPETVRALMVHSANWTDQMRRWLPHDDNGEPLEPRRVDVRRLLRTFGYGVPDEQVALYSASDSLTLIAQDELQPYDRVNGRLVTKDMHLHHLPWPTDALRSLGEADVELQVTLSYFVQPLPGERGYGQNKKHRYGSHGLRFDLKTSTESPEQFSRRINKAMRTEEETATSEADSDHWFLGSKLRGRGSIHSDRWTGSAAELADKSLLAVYPVIGWWRERKSLGKWESRARYSVVVSIRTPGVETDIYTPVAVKLGVPVDIEV